MSLQFWANIFFWSLPILLGAVIGYVTNAIAIKMLFRPLTKKTIFGIKVPFTPGIIPKQRHALAESIGKMVSEKLITESAIKDQLKSDKFQIGLGKSINDTLENIINKPLSLLKKDNLEFFYNSLDDFFSGAINRFFNSKQFYKSLENYISNFIKAISEKKLKDVFSSSNIKHFFSSAVMPFITGKRTKHQIVSTINEWLKIQIENNNKLTQIIPQELIKTIIRSLKYILPDFLKYFSSWLRSPDIHKELKEKGVLILKDIINKLNLFQKIFISMGQYDKSIEDEMPRIINDIIAYLEESMQPDDKVDGIGSVIEKTLNDLLNNGIADISNVLEIDITEHIEPILNKILIYFESEEVKKKLAEVFDEYYSLNEEKMIVEIVENLFDIQVEEINKYAIEQLYVFMGHKNIADNISDKIILLVSEFLKEQSSISIKDFLNINAIKQKNIVIFIKQRLNDILNDKLPYVVESIDVKELVVKKINQLEIVQVEKLLLMVIESHLKWINLFGAIIGSFIGFFQILLNNFIK